MLKLDVKYTFFFSNVGGGQLYIELVLDVIYNDTALIKYCTFILLRRVSIKGIKSPQKMFF